MTVVPLESLPLGFRFRPTDEELVNHYLKRKITGEIQSEREVIPEIDVCKCEPWDLPDKALIRSDDPEWFFFAPKDRKYPNGSRSNRATEKGYWKATGKDRVIRSKGPTRSATVVGMKKTLVFHKGRAPRGERTHWIMHEYRTTELEYESGEQGGYVLYKLFRKSDDRAPGQADEAGPTNIDEVDRSGFSPAPSRSSPLNETQQDGDSLDEITAPPAERKPVLQNDPSNLANSVLGTRVGIQEWLEERRDCKPAKQHENNNSNFALGPSQNMHVGPAPVALLDQISDPRNKKNDYLFGAPKQENHHSVGYPVGDIDQPDAVDDIIDSFFADPDVYSPGESIRQDNSADVAVSDYFDSAIQGDGNQDEAIWPDGMINIDDLLMDVPDDCINGPLYESAFLLYETTDPDVLSIDSGAESVQDLFNTLEESSAQKNNNLILSNDASGSRHPDTLFTQNFARGTREFQADFTSSYNQVNYISSTNEDTIGGGTGIVRRSRGGDCHQQSVHSSVISSNHGTAPRRLFLQTHLEIGTISCPKPDETELGEQVDEDNSGEEVSAESANNASGVEDLEERSINDNGDAPKPKETAKLRKKKIIEGAKNNESVKIKSFVSPKRSPRKFSFAYYLFWIVISALLILFCIGIWRSLTYNINV